MSLDDVRLKIVVLANSIMELQWTDRQDALDELSHQIGSRMCPHCGYNDPTCQCENDE